MKINFLILTFLFLFSFNHNSKAQAAVDPAPLGAWYMYFWNTDFNEGPWGLQGDIQHRNHNILGDLEQLLLRGGATYQLESSRIKFTLGYAFIKSQPEGDSKFSVNESRIYQEALIPTPIGNRFLITHRLRYEQRFIDNQNFRTRYRYNLFLNIPLNSDNLSKGAVYIALYNELFINGKRDINDNVKANVYDRNRSYGAIGYSIKDNLRTQFGAMYQDFSGNSGKWQLQFSLHHKI